MSRKYLLSSKIILYLKRLDAEYARYDDQILSKIIQNSRVYVNEEMAFQEICEDDFREDLYGHDVFLFLDFATLAEIEIDKQSDYCERIKIDLNSVRSIRNEFINRVYFEIEDESDLKYQESTPVKNYTQLDSDTLSFWKSGEIRLFISHRDKHKQKVKILANELEKYGISAFVAHDTIQPMKIWQEEIMKGLQTMEVMLTFITDDFADSCWTNQEIGFALGRGIPIISLKLQDEDPSGFMSIKQAVRGDLENSLESVSQIYQFIVELIGEERCKSVLIEKFLTSKSWKETKKLFDFMDQRIKNLSNNEAKQIIDGFPNNTQLCDSFYLRGNLCNFLKHKTGNSYIIKGKRILLPDRSNVDIPF